MLARQSRILHPSGGELKTPLLIKSFSSKGFRFSIDRKGKPKSEIERILDSTHEAISDSMLLSAYDLKYFLPSLKTLSKKINPEFLFIDSGGYETIDGYDLSDAYKHPRYHHSKLTWTEKDYIKVLDSIPSTFSSILVSYDNGNDKKQSIKMQIDKAEKLFARYDKSLNVFLIKATTSNALLNIDDIKKNISLMAPFKIIGVTEKELGMSIIERMNNIRIIRQALDGVENKAPYTFLVA